MYSEKGSQSCLSDCVLQMWLKSAGLSFPRPWRGVAVTSLGVSTRLVYVGPG